jgi:serralysin
MQKNKQGKVIMQVQFNQWQSINLQDFSDSFDNITDSVKDTDNTLTSLASQNINIYDGSSSRAYGFWGSYDISLTGKNFLGSSPVATSVKLVYDLFGNDEKYQLGGNISASRIAGYTYGINGGTFSSLTHSDDGVTDYTVKGSFTYSPTNSNSINGGTITSAEITQSSGKLTFTGTININANEVITGGTINSLTYTNGTNSFAISNTTIDVSELQSLLQSASDFSTISSFFLSSALLEGNDSITGDAGANTLDGGDGVDKLINNTNNDTYIVDLIKTGKSAASYKVALQDTITEAANAGTDTVQLRSLSGTDYSDMDNATTLTLGANLEDLDASATADIKLNLTGNALDNTLTGNDADNILDGGKGADTLIGGLGDDTYILDLKVVNGDIVFEDSITELDESDEGIDTIKLRGSATLATTTTLTLDSSRGWENIEILDASATGKTKLDLTGNDLGNTLIGNAAVNTLTGGTGNDTLNGVAGADFMVGGDGNDTYYVDNVGDSITERNNQGTDKVFASVSYTLTDYIEDLELTGKAAINGIGNDLDNDITGNTGNNILDGGLGADTLRGGKGNDTYIVDDEDDEVIELDKEGTDLVKASISYELSDYIENLTLTGSDDINGTGNSLNNTITGNTGNNTLDGGAGVDKLAGGLGDDTYIVDLLKTGSSAANFKFKLEDSITEGKDAGNDTVQLRGSFTDANNATTLTLGANLENLDASQTDLTKLNLTGNALNNILTGNNANNVLDGGKGDDILIGGLGSDTLKGGLGADVFKWGADDVVSPGDVSSNTDTITDFSLAQGDQLDLRDLLDGESESNISDYIQVDYDSVTGSTYLRISSTGNFTNGNYNASEEDARIVLSKTNLLDVTGENSYAAAIDHMITQNQLLIG